MNNKDPKSFQIYHKMLGRLKTFRSLVGHSSFCKNHKEYLEWLQWGNFLMTFTGFSSAAYIYESIISSYQYSELGSLLILWKKPFLQRNWKEKCAVLSVNTKKI